jgi:glutathione S-transferase
MFLYSVDIAALVAQRQFGLDVFADLPAACDLLQRLGANPNVQVIAKRRDAETPAFIAAVRARYQGAK